MQVKDFFEGGGIGGERGQAGVQSKERNGREIQMFLISDTPYTHS